MAISNMDRFDQASGLIFTYLSSHFPTRASLSCGLIEPVFKDMEEKEEDWLTKFSSKDAFFNSTVRWLIDADFIWCEGSHKTIQTIYERCVLTPKALEAMRSLPPSLTGESLTQAVGDTLKSASLDTAKAIASQLMSKGFSLAGKAAISIAGA